MTTDLPASLDDKHLIPWLVILDYGDEDVIANEDAWAILYPAYLAKAAAVRDLVGREREACAKLCDARASSLDETAKTFWDVLGGGHGPSVAKSYEAAKLASEARANAAKIRARGAN